MKHFRHAVAAYYAAAVADAVVAHLVEGAIGGLAGAVISALAVAALAHAIAGKSAREMKPAEIGYTKSAFPTASIDPILGGIACWFGFALYGFEANATSLWELARSIPFGMAIGSICLHTVRR